MKTFRTVGALLAMLSTIALSNEVTAQPEPGSAVVAIRLGHSDTCANGSEKQALDDLGRLEGVRKVTRSKGDVFAVDYDQDKTNPEKIVTAFNEDHPGWVAIVVPDTR